MRFLFALLLMLAVGSAASVLPASGQSRYLDRHDHAAGLSSARTWSEAGTTRLVAAGYGNGVFSAGVHVGRVPSEAIGHDVSTAGVAVTGLATRQREGAFLNVSFGAAYQHGWLDWVRTRSFGQGNGWTHVYTNERFTSHIFTLEATVSRDLAATQTWSVIPTVGMAMSPVRRVEGELLDPSKPSVLMSLGVGVTVGRILLLAEPAFVFGEEATTPSFGAALLYVHRRP